MTIWVKTVHRIPVRKLCFSVVIFWKVVKFYKLGDKLEGNISV